MIYIPDEWIRNKENEETIRDILDRICTCIKTTDYKKDLSEAKKSLEEMGEDIIIEKLEDGIFKI